MFTGIVKAIGTISIVEEMPGGLEFVIATDLSSQLSIDESVSVSGVCLTVIDSDTRTFRVQCVGETLRKTTLSHLRVGDSVNLERAVPMDRALDGHVVQGHVDTTGRIREIRTSEGTDRLLRIEFMEEFQDLVVDRGSITMDGISLTLARVGSGWFEVAIIPYTWEQTTLRDRVQGDRVNLEFDLFGKYVVAYLKRHSETGSDNES